MAASSPDKSTNDPPKLRFVSESDKAKLTDAQNKMNIIKSVMEVCDAKLKKTNPAFLANIDKADMALVSKLPNPSTFRNCFEEWMAINEHMKKGKLNFYTDQAREIFYEEYVVNRKIPTVESLMKALEEKEVHKTKFTTSLHFKILGIAWEKLPNSDRYLLYENPVEFMNRTRYLEKIMHFRSENRHIVYVEEKYLHCVNAKHTLKECVTAAISSDLGVLSSFYFPKYDAKQLHFWFVNSVLGYVPKNSVIVVESNNDHVKCNMDLPKASSSKVQMIDWLISNDIPFDRNAHNAQLYALIQTYKKKNSRDYVMDEVMSNYGHEVLYRPSGLTKLNYFNEFWLKFSRVEEVKHMRLASPDYAAMLRDLTIEQLKKMENDLAKAEEECYRQDMQVEEIIDKLLLLSRNERIHNESDTSFTELQNYDVGSKMLVE